MKTFVFDDPNSSISITISAKDEEDAREQIADMNPETLRLSEEEDEEDEP